MVKILLPQDNPSMISFINTASGNNSEAQRYIKKWNLLYWKNAPNTCQLLIYLMANKRMTNNMDNKLPILATSAVPNAINMVKGNKHIANTLLIKKTLNK